MYHSLQQQDIDFLTGLIPPERLLTGEAIGSEYGHDEMVTLHSLPEAIAYVKSTDEISAILRYANKKQIPVTTRGAGTGLVGAAVPVQGGILLVTTQMNRILELDRENMTVTVEPGVLLKELSDYVESAGLFYPPDPGEKGATIGGNISTNAGGMRAVKYGVTRDYVAQLTAVLPDGTVMQMGSKTVKNSSGYALKDLLVGSEGTLAVITQATLRLLSKPGYSTSLLLSFEDIGAAVHTVPQLVRLPAKPTAIEYMTREVILCAEQFLQRPFPDKSADAYLLLTFDGADEESVEGSYMQAAELGLELGALDALVIDLEKQKKAVWSMRDSFLEAIKASTTQMDECDVVVPRSRLADFILFTQELAVRSGLRLPSFGHAGDGNLHIYLCRDDLDEQTWQVKSQDVFDRLYAAADEMGGCVSGEHGIGYCKKTYLQRQLGEEQVDLMRWIKRAFDPKGILNCDKVFSLTPDDGSGENM